MGDTTITDPLALEVLRTLTRATGPLTANEVRERLSVAHHGYLPYGEVYNRLVRLATIGRLESRADTFPGHHPVRLFWLPPR